MTPFGFINDGLSNNDSVKNWRDDDGTMWDVIDDEEQPMGWSW